MQKNEQPLHDTFYIRELKKRLEIISTITVKEFNDCKNLSNLLYEKGIAISAHTFARFFCLLKETHRPYTSTLNLLCEYIGYRSYNDFCLNFENEINQALYAPRDLFKTGDYSLIALEISIANNDWIGMKAILEAIDTTKLHIHDLVITLGNAVRAHPLQQELLRELNKTEKGGRLFYECYVDEDDRNYYYSNSLKEYYKTATKTTGNQLFLECFLASKAIYQHQKIDIQSYQLIQISDFSYGNLHFHEISRFFEIQLLLDFQNRELNKNLTAHLEKIIYTTTATVQHSEACWILARSLKALSFAGMLKKAMSYSPFNLLVFKLFKQLNAKIDSIGELIIQFVGHVFFVKNQQEAFQIPPSKIAVKCDNETNARILIESATASLYAKSSVKSILDNNIHSFAKQTGQTWVFELLY
jgi:hypothetical protein